MGNELLIIGGGHQGLAMAAHFALEGVKVNLWNRTSRNITEILKNSEVNVSGIINGRAKLHKVSEDIDEVMAQTIMVTTPATAHRDIAGMLASRVNAHTTIILNPGRTFGALDFFQALREHGCTCMPMIAETQTIVYTCRRDTSNSVMVYALKNSVAIAALFSEQMQKILDVIPACVRERYIPAATFLETSFSNVGMILHCAPVLMNIGWIENEACEFKYYYDGISKSVAKLLEKMDMERIAVGQALGVSVDSVVDWLKQAYSVQGDSLYECIRNNQFYRNIDAPRSVSHRYLEEDVPFGLVPVEHIAKKLHISVPTISLVIDLASAVMEKDYRQIGRKIDVSV